MDGISYSFDGDDIIISCPYTLKDELKRAFRSAKWDHDAIWRIKNRPNTRAKFEKWAEIVNESGVDGLIEEFEAKKLTVAAIKKLNQQLEDIGVQIKIELEEYDQFLAENKTLETLIHDLEANQDVLEKAKSENERLKAEAKAKTQKVIDILHNIVNMDAVRASHRKLNTLARRRLTSDDKSVFRENQKIIDLEAAKLFEAGWQSMGLDKLRFANLNRLDRDDPRDVCDDDFVRLKKVASE